MRTNVTCYVMSIVLNPVRKTKLKLHYARFLLLNLALKAQCLGFEGPNIILSEVCTN